MVTVDWGLPACADYSSDEPERLDLHLVRRACVPTRETPLELTQITASSTLRISVVKKRVISSHESTEMANMDCYQRHFTRRVISPYTH